MFLLYLKLITEGEWWLSTINNSEKLPKDGLFSYGDCDDDEDTFLTIKKYLQILVTLPITIASAKRKFSSVKRLNIWLRLTMTVEKLVELALLNNTDIEINVSEIINRFSSKKSRKSYIML